jgi:hypothetical protein
MGGACGGAGGPSIPEKSSRREVTSPEIEGGQSDDSDTRPILQKRWRPNFGASRKSADLLSVVIAYLLLFGVLAAIFAWFVA